jgi:multicomponent Na+:H+ antiporter subunit B
LTRAWLRTWLFLPAAVGMAGLFWWSYGALPPVGDYSGLYGDYIARYAISERHATDTVNAVTYDYRGIDTLGEEFILFASVIGVLLLFRRQPEQPPATTGSKENEQIEETIPSTDTIRVTMQGMVAVMVVFGLYIASHGQLTPGGGFQGGVILATAALIIYLGGRVETFERAVSHPLAEIAEAVGAAGYAIIGVSALVLGAAFLTNWLPLGQIGQLLSSGTILAISLAVGLEVTGGFALLMNAYLKEVIEQQGEE